MFFYYSHGHGGDNDVADNDDVDNDAADGNVADGHGYAGDDDDVVASRYESTRFF